MYKCPVTTKRPAARRYPRDLTVGSRVLTRLNTPRGVRAVPGSITTLEKVVGGRYRIVVETDAHGRVNLGTVAANAKLDTIR